LRADDGRLGLTAAAAALVMLTVSCSEITDPEPAAAFPVPTGTWRQVVPGPGLPSAVTTYASNNNLDVILHGGALYLAFRTAPTHFASAETLIQVVRADDPERHETWVHEATFALGRDAREPRFFEVGGRLHLYVATLGSDLVAFEPGQTLGWTRSAEGAWIGPRTVFDDGRILWRARTIEGQLYATAYLGGDKMYAQITEGRVDDVEMEVLLLTSDDGDTWRGVDPDRPVVLRGGASETDFAFDEHGDLYAVSRNETGDESGFGSRLCRAPAADPANWTCLARSDPHKYDSPLVFRQGRHIYLIARFNPAGAYDLEPGAPVTLERWWRNEWTYSSTPKRTALYGYDTAKMRIVPLDIFPTSGDTAFASAVRLDERRLLVFNYSSDPAVPDMSWIEGQFAGSGIWSAVLTFPEAP
jgi:hypothetical protein